MRNSRFKFMTAKTVAIVTAFAFTACSAPVQTSQSQESDAVSAASTQTVTESSAQFQWPRSYEYMPDGAMLIFSATRDWRHDSGIAGASAFWARLSDDTARGLFITENAGVFTPENLVKFDTIILNSVTGDVLNTAQQSAIESFVEAGGGLIAQHGTGDSSLAKFWPWWSEQFGTEFVSHPADPQFQTADVVNLAKGHPVMNGLGDVFSHNDEWYTFTGPVSGDVIVLAGLDESSYSPVNNVYGPSDLRMGPEPSDHPIIWAKCPGQGRLVYSALGHKTDSYDNPAHRKLLENALVWVENKAGTAKNSGCP